jgi:hypothetical protein
MPRAAPVINQTDPLGDKTQSVVSIMARDLFAGVT